MLKNCRTFVTDGEHKKTPIYATGDNKMEEASDMALDDRI